MARRPRTPKGLTKAQRKKYLYDGHSKCPYCLADDITGDSVEITAQGAWQEVSCQACGRRWTDVYKLSDIYENDLQ